MSKLIAFHLPQFHSIPENDKWWGEGFTEWTNTRKTTAIFEGHNQPREPYNENYYNMLDYDTRKWQVNLAKEYGVYGFCYYHYWFNGKLLLEKPLELLLQEKDINFPFCLCWANEPWTRSWDGANKEILVDQVYGDEESWEKHLQYLLPFFKDNRYIKKDNKPIFVLYRTSNIPNCDKMIEYWDSRCKENGLKGIFIVEELNSFQKQPQCENSEAIIEFEPMYTLAELPTIQKGKRKLHGKINEVLKISRPYYYDYDYIWNRIINRKNVNYNKKLFLGAFIDWDNSPRRRKNAVIFKGVKPEKYGNYLKQQLNKANKIDSEFVFINAWNEWAEGTYLEPDKKSGYKYLEATKKALNIEEISEENY